MELFVTNYGSFIGKKSERLVIKENGKVVNEVPFHAVEQVIIETTGASLSTDVIRECAEHGIPITFLAGNGQPYAKLISPHLTGTVITRREQLLAYNDSRGVELAKAFVDGKLRNQITTLKYFGKYRKSSNLQAYQQLNDAIATLDKYVDELKQVKGTCIDDVRGQIMSVEGRAGNIYWQGVKLLTEGKVDFPGREHRGATDPMNALLNYGYGILTSQAETALLLAGLDVFGGYLHVDRAGKKSLVYDFVEEFRQTVVDRTVIAMINKGITAEVVDGQLIQETRRELAQRVMERLDASEKFQGKKYRLRTIIQMQARRIPTFLRGEAGYRPFVCGW